MKIHPRKLAAAWLMWSLVLMILTVIATNTLAQQEGIIRVEYIVMDPEELQATEPEEVEPQVIERSLGTYEVTAYCACEQCTGPYNDGITYSGEPAVEGVTIAADIDKHPIGTELYIEGVGYRTVQDIGGSIYGDKIDVYFDSHQEALEFGRQQLEVWEVE